MCLITTWSSATMKSKEPGHVCEETEKIVSSCFRGSEVLISRKCSEICGGFEGRYKYHCMRDSLKRNVFAFCAIPKLLFDYCPEYDRKGKRIQIDISTNCTTDVSKRYYNSSDISFCDPDRCLQLSEKRVIVIRTNVTKGAAPKNKGDGHKDRIFQILYIIIISISVIALISIAILFAKCRDRICNKYSTKEYSMSNGDELCL